MVYWVGVSALCGVSVIECPYENRGTIRLNVRFGSTEVGFGDMLGIHHSIVVGVL